MRHLILTLSLLLLPGCPAFMKCMTGGDNLHHVADEVVDLAEDAHARGISPDSDDWRGVLGGLAGKVGACLVAGAADDLLRHLERHVAGPPVMADCARCRAQHHAHEPRQELRLYFERARRQVPPGALGLRL